MANAASAAKAILKGRGISRVVVVDDDVGQPSWYELIELLDSEEKAEIGQETGFNILSDGWRERLDLADRETRKCVGHIVEAVATDRGIPRPERGPGDPALAALKEVLRSHQPQELTPSQWQRRANELINRARSEPTLFLIDQRLGEGRKGGDLVRDLLKRSSEGCFFCILTAEVGITDEFDYWQRMCEGYGFQPGQVGIVAKEHLIGDLFGFVRMLKISLTAGEVKRVQDGVLAAAKEGLEEGLSRFEELEPSYSHLHCVRVISCRGCLGGGDNSSGSQGVYKPVTRQTGVRQSGDSGCRERDWHSRVRRHW